MNPQTKKIMSGTTLAISLIITPGCYSPCSDLSIEEIISSISTLEEAQECLNEQISYSYLPRKRALNGAYTQSVNNTFDKKEGICTDGAVAIASMLKDNNYPSLVLGVDFNEQEIGHAVFVAEQEGTYSTGGINTDDYRPPFYLSLDNLAESIAKQYSFTVKRVTLFDLSVLNLIQGTNDSLVNIDPFIIRSNDDTFNSTGKITKLDNGYHVSTIYNDDNGSLNEEIIYTPDTYENEIKKEWVENKKLYHINWKVISRHPFRLPFETIKESYENDNLYLYENSFLEYYPDGQKQSEKTLTSNDGDKSIDFITKNEYNEDGSINKTYHDNDADGVWD